MKFYYGVNPGEKREKLLKSEAAESIIAKMISSADKALLEEISVLKMSDYIRYTDEGDRTIFERQYFGRRRNCTDIFMAYWNYGFGHFVIQAQIVKEYTDGKINYF